MSHKLNRREFLKLAGLIPLTYYIPHLILKPESFLQGGKGKNVIIVVFDAFSARNISFHGYQRETTPNLTRLAERATVYHNHYAGSNFTYPGTAALLTGTYPWTNRGFSPFIGIDQAYAEKNIFKLFNQHYRVIYTHNPVAQSLMKEFNPHIEKFKHRQELFLGHDLISDLLFRNDEDIASVSWAQAMIREGNRITYSLFLSHLYNWYSQGKIEEFAEIFPRGIPNIRNDNFFLLEDAIDWTKEKAAQLPQPFLGYFHFLPPHDPYFTRIDFTDAFEGDGFEPIEKPEHLFTQGRTYIESRKDRHWYDEFILFVDAEFGRLYNDLATNGILDNTWLIFTSDHGEMFERGFTKHYNESLHQPVIQIPLLIFEPGGQTRKDIYTPTSAVDLLPTLLHITDKEVPDWCEGEVLPPYNSSEPDSDRSIFALEAKKNKMYQPVNSATAMIVKSQYKLTYYFGYEKLNGRGPLIELYDILNDPEELDNLSETRTSITNELLDELLAKLQAADAPYSSS